MMPACRPPLCSASQAARPGAAPLNIANKQERARLPGPLSSAAKAVPHVIRILSLTFVSSVSHIACRYTTLTLSSALRDAWIIDLFIGSTILGKCEFGNAAVFTSASVRQQAKDSSLSDQDNCRQSTARSDGCQYQQCPNSKAA